MFFHIILILAGLYLGYIIANIIDNKRKKKQRIDSFSNKVAQLRKEKQYKGGIEIKHD